MKLAKIQAFKRGMTKKCIGVKYECDIDNKIYLNSRYSKNNLTIFIESPLGITETKIDTKIDLEEAEIILMWVFDYIEIYGYSCYEEWYNDPLKIDIKEMLPYGYEVFGNIEIEYYDKFCEKTAENLKNKDLGGIATQAL